MPQNSDPHMSPHFLFPFPLKFIVIWVFLPHASTETALVRSPMTFPCLNGIVSSSSLHLSATFDPVDDSLFPNLLSSLGFQNISPSLDSSWLCELYTTEPEASFPPQSASPVLSHLRWSNFTLQYKNFGVFHASFSSYFTSDSKVNCVCPTFKIHPGSNYFSEISFLPGVGHRFSTWLPYWFP